MTGKESLFQQAALRLANLGNADIQVASPMIVTGEDHRFLASEQLREIGVELDCALLEPVGRNTAPALTLAAFAAMESGADPVLVVTPADQTVVKADAFTAAMQQAVAEAANGTIVILGVTPDKPETGYGYSPNDLGLVVDGADVKRVCCLCGPRLVNKSTPAVALEWQATSLSDSGVLHFLAGPTPHAGCGRIRRIHIN